MQRCAEGHKAYKNIQESVLCLLLTGCPPDVHVGQRMRAGVLYITVAQGLRPNLPSLGDHKSSSRVLALTFYNLVIDSLFTSEDQVKQVLAVLEPFWPGLDPFVSVQHMQNPILCIAEHQSQGALDK